jgi:hypothetical protein
MFCNTYIQPLQKTALSPIKKEEKSPKKHTSPVKIGAMDMFIKKEKRENQTDLSKNLTSPVKTTGIEERVKKEKTESNRDEGPSRKRLNGTSMQTEKPAKRPTPQPPASVVKQGFVKKVRCKKHHIFCARNIEWER